MKRTTNYLARDRWKRAIRKVIRQNKWPNIKDAIAFEKYTGNHGPYWRRIPVKNKYGNYKRKKKYYQSSWTNSQWYLDKDGDWVLRRK